MSKEVLLYDCANKQGRCYSPNVWKARAVLNYKGIPYETIWLEYPDIEPTLMSLGIPGNDPSEVFRWSLPVIKLPPDGAYAMESRNVASALENLQPTPSLHLDSGYVGRTQDAVNTMLFVLGPAYMYRIPDKLLNPESFEWYHESRGKLLGASLYELAKHPDWSGATAWKKAEAGFEVTRKLLGENASGPFVMGEQISYADFVLAAWWMASTKLDEGGDLFDRMMAYDSSFGEHWKACEPYFERDDH